MEAMVLSPAEFVGLINQTFEVAYPLVVIEGELSSFRVSKGQWVYFDLKDETAKVSFFGSVYQLPGPLEDGLTVRVIGAPRLHPRFGFSVSFQSISPVGQGSLKKAADLLAKKLEAEGLFANERKRPLPIMPQRIGLITAATSAAYADFIKIISERWSGIEIEVADVLVQGDKSPTELVSAIDQFNKLATPPEILVMTRGGGSAEDLAAFNDERVVRAVAASRIPMLVAVGHEIDVSLAELAADMRASTPTNAAQIIVPDKTAEFANLEYEKRHLATKLRQIHLHHLQLLNTSRQLVSSSLKQILLDQQNRLVSYKNLAKLLDPKAALKRGYAIVSFNGKNIKSIKQVAGGSNLDIDLSDGRIKAIVEAMIE